MFATPVVHPYHSLSFSHTCARKHSHSHTRTYLRAMEHALTHSSTNSAKVRRLKRELNLYFEKEWYTRSPLLLLSRSLSLSLSLSDRQSSSHSRSRPLSFSCYVFVVWVWLPADNLITSCCSSVLVRLRLETSLSLSPSLHHLPSPLFTHFKKRNGTGHDYLCPKKSQSI